MDVARDIAKVLEGLLSVGHDLAGMIDIGLRAAERMAADRDDRQEALLQQAVFWGAQRHFEAQEYGQVRQLMEPLVVDPSVGALATLAIAGAAFGNGDADAAHWIARAQNRSDAPAELLRYADALADCQQAREGDDWSDAVTALRRLADAVDESASGLAAQVLDTFDALGAEASKEDPDVDRLAALLESMPPGKPGSATDRARTYGPLLRAVAAANVGDVEGLQRGRDSLVAMASDANGGQQAVMIVDALMDLAAGRRDTATRILRRVQSELVESPSPIASPLSELADALIRDGLPCSWVENEFWPSSDEGI